MIASPHVEIVKSGYRFAGVAVSMGSRGCSVLDLSLQPLIGLA